MLDLVGCGNAGVGDRANLVRSAEQGKAVANQLRYIFHPVDDLHRIFP
jgi:hypothetical protein